MRSEIRLPLFFLKAAIFLFALSAAASAQQTLNNVGPESLAWWKWAFILIFSLIGWSIAELDKAADLVFPEGLSPKQRLQSTLKFGQGLIASLFAGIGMYFVTEVAPGWINMQQEIPEMLELLAVTTSAYGGSRFLGWLSVRFGFTEVAQKGGQP